MLKDLVLTIELRLLAYSAFVALILWVPYILAAMQVRGVSGVAGYPTGSYGDLPDWAQRCHRAHLNLLENLAPFAILVLVALLTGALNEMTALGARLFFWARIAQTLVHIAGIAWARTLFFVIGWAGNLLIFMQIVS